MGTNSLAKRVSTGCGELRTPQATEQQTLDDF